MEGDQQKIHIKVKSVGIHLLFDIVKGSKMVSKDPQLLALMSFCNFFPLGMDGLD